MRALIDADSMVYIIAWAHREGGSTDEVKMSCDVMLKDIMALTNADDYIGVFSPPSEDTFRAEVYRYAKYKGTRPDKTENVKLWEETIKQHLTSVHGFFKDPELEADDIIAGIASLMLRDNLDYVICSPDKDLGQIPGLHFDYRGTNATGILNVTMEESHWNFWTQMLTGDGTDNVAGVPGLGPVKVKKLMDALKESGDMISTKAVVTAQYINYFGQYYGPIIFEETLKTLRLMVPYHSLWPAYKKRIEEYAGTKVRALVARNGFFDVAS